jgi:hypothetical protein
MLNIVTLEAASTRRQKRAGLAFYIKQHRFGENEEQLKYLLPQQLNVGRGPEMLTQRNSIQDALCQV